MSPFLFLRRIVSALPFGSPVQLLLVRHWLFIFLFTISLVPGVGIAVLLFVDRESNTSRELSLTVPGSNGYDHVFGLYLTQG